MTFYVDAATTVATTQQNGTTAKPYRGITAAAALARAGDTVLIKPGTYRESVMPPCAGSSGHAITFRKWGTGNNPVISGSEKFSNPGTQWTASGSGYKWNWAPEAGWNAALNTNGYFTFRNSNPDILTPSVQAAMRAELITAVDPADGLSKPLRLASSASTLQPGTMFVQTAGTCDYAHPGQYGYISTAACAPVAIYARFWGNSTPQVAKPEIGIREALFRGVGHATNTAQGGNYQLWDLAFRYANNRVQDAAVCLAKGPIDCGADAATGQQAYGSGSIVIGVETSFNNSVGINLGGADNLYIGSTSRDNGQLGIKGLCNRCSLNDGYVYGNNWKGYDPAWEAGGIKMLFTRNSSFTRMNVSSNNGPGIWLDTDNFNNVIQGNLVINNLRDGIFLELNTHNTLVQHNIVTGTRRLEYQFGAGIQLSSSYSNYLYHNSIFGNEAVGILLEPDVERSPNGNYYNRFVNNLMLFNGSDNIWGSASGSSNEIYARAQCGPFNVIDEFFTNNLVYDHSSSPTEYPDSLSSGSTMVYGRTAGTACGAATYVNTNRLSVLQSVFGEGGNNFATRADVNAAGITPSSIVFEPSFHVANTGWSTLSFPYVLDVNQQDSCDRTLNASCVNIAYYKRGAAVDAYYDSDWISNNTPAKRAAVAIDEDAEAYSWESIRLGPNPATSRVDVERLPDGGAHYALYSVTGRLVAEGDASSSQMSLPVTDLPAGIYLLRLSGQDGGARTMRFTVVR